MKIFYNLCLKDDIAALDGDILSGVRKGYFSGFQKIRDKITINSDSDCISYDYSIEKDKPMSWEVRAQDKKLLQDVTSSDEGKYYICFYRDEALYKRILFSRKHTLLRVEYYDVPTGMKTVSLEPRKAKDGLCILYESAASSHPIVLYPAPSIGEGPVRDRVEKGFDDYTVTASTDDGVVRFLSESQEKALYAFIEAAAADLAAKKEESFVGEDTPLFDRIKAKDFNVKRNLANALDITKAKEFTLPREEEPTASPETDAEATAVAEAAAAAIGLALGAVETAAEPVAETPGSVEPAVAEAPAEDVSPEIKPDKLIMADGAMYSYYGELDASGNRSGYGRTLTDEGRTAYEGHYKNDKRFGTGSYYYKDGSLCYTGDWVENVRHGVGVGVSSHDGSIHVGRWALNKPEGSGVRLSADGEIRFVCKELSDKTTVLMNYTPDDSVVIAKYDEKGKKLGEMSVSLKDFLK